MAKAYDRLEWRFLLRALKNFGFSDTSWDLIYRNICDIWYTLRINGEHTGNFHSFQGVRQGDPLSTLLFVIAQQIFFSNLKRAIHRHAITPYSIGRHDHPISHLFYADDVLIFTNGSACSLNNFMSLIHAYELSSGQKVNRQKSNFYLGSRAERRGGAIAQITRLEWRDFPLMYLGVPIFYGHPRAVFYQHLVDKVIRALDGWKARSLSFGGKLTLIKSVLSSIPIYTLSSSVVLASVTKRIEGIMAAFLWNYRGEVRTHWVSWKSICTPIEEGGLGIRCLQMIRDSLHANLMWHVIEGKTLMSKYAQAKYLRGNSYAHDSTREARYGDQLLTIMSC